MVRMCIAYVHTDFYVNRTGRAPPLLHVDIDRLQFGTVV